jgi:hypothetical protein
VIPTGPAARECHFLALRAREIGYNDGEAARQKVLPATGDKMPWSIPGREAVPAERREGEEKWLS